VVTRDGPSFWLIQQGVFYYLLFLIELAILEIIFQGDVRMIVKAEAAVAALPAPTEAYLLSFSTCLTSITLAGAIKRQIKYDIADETKVLNDWQ